MSKPINILPIRKISLLFIFALLIPVISLANFIPKHEAFLTIKLYSEPGKRNIKLSYIISSSNNTNYSYYHGSDLPVWRFTDDKAIHGELRAAELANVRVHFGLPNIHHRKIRLMVIDIENKRIIWKGELNCEIKKHIIHTKVITDNQTYYDTKIKFDKITSIFSLETMGK